MWALMALMSAWQMYIIIIIIIYRASIHNTRSNRTIIHVVCFCSFIHIEPFDAQLWVKKGNFINKVPESQQLVIGDPALSVYSSVLLFWHLTFHIHVDIRMHVSTHMLFNNEVLQGGAVKGLSM